MEHLNNLFQQAAGNGADGGGGGAGADGGNDNANPNNNPNNGNAAPPRPPRSDFAREAYAAAFQHEMMNAFGLGEQFVASRVAATSRESAPEQRTGPPPMDEAALRDLPVVRATEEDLAKDGNRECCVCLEAQEVGDRATKLPCGHLFHTECVVQWLRKHGTCPSCRYELASSDAAFEASRRERMARRVPRYRRRELGRRPVRRCACRGARRPRPRVDGKGDLVKASLMVASSVTRRGPAARRDARGRRAWSTRQLAADGGRRADPTRASTSATSSTRSRRRAWWRSRPTTTTRRRRPTRE